MRMSAVASKVHTALRCDETFSSGSPVMEMYELMRKAVFCRSAFQWPIMTGRIKVSRKTNMYTFRESFRCTIYNMYSIHEYDLICILLNSGLSKSFLLKIKMFKEPKTHTLAYIFILYTVSRVVLYYLYLRV